MRSWDALQLAFRTVAGHYRGEDSLVQLLELREAIAATLAPRLVRPFDDIYFDGEAKEAVAFAFLGWLHLQGRAGNVPAAPINRVDRGGFGGWRPLSRYDDCRAWERHTAYQRLNRLLGQMTREEQEEVRDRIVKAIDMSTMGYDKKDWDRIQALK